MSLNQSQGLLGMACVTAVHQSGFIWAHEQNIVGRQPTALKKMKGSGDGWDVHGGILNRR
jgi:hypothetical protein